MCALAVCGEASLVHLHDYNPARKYGIHAASDFQQACIVKSEHTEEPAKYTVSTRPAFALKKRIDSALVTFDKDNFNLRNKNTLVLVMRWRNAHDRFVVRIVFNLGALVCANVDRCGALRKRNAFNNKKI